MNRETLEVRRAELLADHYTIVGHLQELDYWLAQLDREEATFPPSDEPPALHPVLSQEDAG